LYYQRNALTPLILLVDTSLDAKASAVDSTAEAVGVLAAALLGSVGSWLLYLADKTLEDPAASLNAASNVDSPVMRQIP